MCELYICIYIYTYYIHIIYILYTYYIHICVCVCIHCIRAYRGDLHAQYSQPHVQQCLINISISCFLPQRGWNLYNLATEESMAAQWISALRCESTDRGNQQESGNCVTYVSIGTLVSKTLHGVFHYKVWPKHF